MAIIFYPSEDVIKKNEKTSYRDKIAILRDAAEKYKTYVLEQISSNKELRVVKPSLLKAAFNWDFIVKVLQEIYSTPEDSAEERALKADNLLKLSEVYSILRTARMPKLENTRFALFQYSHKLTNDTLSK